jgi:hypothetical protein
MVVHHLGQMIPVARDKGRKGAMLKRQSGRMPVEMYPMRELDAKMLDGNTTHNDTTLMTFLMQGTITTSTFPGFQSPRPNLRPLYDLYQWEI